MPPRQMQAQAQKQVTKQQSLQQCKDLVIISLSAFAYLRHLFAEDSFETESLEPDQPNQSQKGNRKSTFNVQRLQRGRSSSVDSLLDYLEKGVYDALEKGYLASLVVGLHLDPDKPETIVESYTYNFDYVDAADGSKAPILDLTDDLCGLNVTSDTRPSRTPALTMQDLRKTVRTIMKSLVMHVGVAGNLPDRTYLRLKLHYVKDCPEDYEPPLFGPAGEHAFFFETTSFMHRPDKLKVGELQTGSHKMSVHFATTVDDYKDAQEIEDPVERAEVNAATPRPLLWNGEEQAHDGYQPVDDMDTAFHDLGHLDEEEREKLRSVGIGVEYPFEAPIGLRTDDNRILPVPAFCVEKARERDRKRRMGIMVPAEDDLNDVESFVGRSLIRHLEGQPASDELEASALHSPDWNEACSSTAASSPAYHFQSRLNSDRSILGNLSLNSLAADRSPLRDSQTVFSAGLDGDSIEDSPTIKPSAVSRQIDVLESIEEDPEAMQVEQSQASRREVIQPQAETIVPAPAPSQSAPMACPCGFDAIESGHMLSCSKCGSQLHAACMGVWDQSSASLTRCSCYEHRFGATHLLPIGLEVLVAQARNRLQLLCRERRALYKLNQSGRGTTLAAFATMMDIEESRATQIKNVLVGKGLVAESRPGRGRNVRSSLTLVKKAEINTRRLNDYFNPGGGLEEDIWQQYDTEAAKLYPTLFSPEQGSRNVPGISNGNRILAAADKEDQGFVPSRQSSLGKNRSMDDEEEGSRDNIGGSSKKRRITNHVQDDDMFLPGDIPRSDIRDVLPRHKSSLSNGHVETSDPSVFEANAE